MRWPGTGYPMTTKDLGVLEKCPYCTKTNIKKRHKVQKTCAGIPCKAMLQADNNRKCKENAMRKKARREAA